MPDSEWFTVEDQGGTALRVDGEGTQAPNLETALAAGRAMQATRPDPLTVVNYTRIEMFQLDREITVKETDLSTDPEPSEA